jgi:predicted alpha-1,6-mannanase (GH76 family)
MLTDDAQLRQYYLDWALRMYDWLNQYMQAPDGLYWDHVRADGSVDMGLYSYNQGAMIGTNVMLYQVTGETHYLDSAVRIADAAVKALSGEALYRQQVAFNALFFRDLLQLNELRPDARYLETILSYADYLWNNARDPRTGLFTTSAPLTLLDQAAMGGIYAMLAGYGLDGSTATRWTAP